MFHEVKWIKYYFKSNASAFISSLRYSTTFVELEKTSIVAALGGI
jgi:hypothetical protein